MLRLKGYIKSAESGSLAEGKKRLSLRRNVCCWSPYLKFGVHLLYLLSVRLRECMHVSWSVFLWVCHGGKSITHVLRRRFGVCLWQESRCVSIFICIQIMLLWLIPPVTIATGFTLDGTLTSAGGMYTLQVLSNTSLLKVFTSGWALFFFL